MFQFIDFSQVPRLQTFAEHSAGFADDYTDDNGAHASLAGYVVDASAALGDAAAGISAAVGTDMFGLGTQSLSYIDSATGQTTVIELHQQNPA